MKHFLPCDCGRLSCLRANWYIWMGKRDKFLKKVAALAHDRWFEGQVEPWTVHKGDWRICVHPSHTEPRAMVHTFDGQHHACSFMLDQRTGAYSSVYIPSGYKIL